MTVRYQRQSCCTYRSWVDGLVRRVDAARKRGLSEHQCPQSLSPQPIKAGRFFLTFPHRLLTLQTEHRSKVDCLNTATSTPSSSCAPLSLPCLLRLQWSQLCLKTVALPFLYVLAHLLRVCRSLLVSCTYPSCYFSLLLLQNPRTSSPRRGPVDIGRCARGEVQSCPSACRFVPARCVETCTKERC